MKKYIIGFLFLIFSFGSFTNGIDACDQGIEDDCCLIDIERCCDLWPNNTMCGGGNQNQGGQGNGGGSSGNCVKITLNNGTQIDYCGPSECESAYEDFGNNPSNNNLKQDYRDCIAQYGPNNGGLNIGEPCTTDEECGDGKICEIEENTGGGTCQLDCPEGQEYINEAGNTQCCDGLVQNGKCLVNNEGSMGIEMDQDCLINGQCKFSIYDTLGIRQSLPKETRSSPGIFIQDIILSATFFVGTVMTAVLIISGLLFVLSGFNADLHSKAKKGVIGSLVGLLFVSGSYAFVRLIQFLVTGGGG